MRESRVEVFFIVLHVADPALQSTQLILNKRLKQSNSAFKTYMRNLSSGQIALRIVHLPRIRRLYILRSSKKVNGLVPSQRGLDLQYVRNPVRTVVSPLKFLATVLRDQAVVWPSRKALPATWSHHVEVLVRRLFLVLEMVRTFHC